MKVRVMTKTISSLLIIAGTIGLLFFLFSIFGVFNLSNKHIQDTEAADFLISFLQRKFSETFLILLLSTGIIWIVSFWKKLIKPLLACGLIVAAMLVFAILLARLSECEGLACIGPGFILHFSLLGLIFLANSIGFILLLKVSESAGLVRWLSTTFIVLFSVGGILLYQYAASNLQRTAEHNLSTKIDTLFSELTLFTPSYLPSGVTRKVEKVHDFDGTCEQFYFLEDGHISIEQSKPQGQFEEYERYLNDPKINADSHLEEILIDGARAIISLDSTGADLVFLNNGTEIRIRVHDSISSSRMKEEAINIAQSLKPRSELKFIRENPEKVSWKSK